jgi:hypothetical protein
VENRTARIRHRLIAFDPGMSGALTAVRTFVGMGTAILVAYVWLEISYRIWPGTAGTPQARYGHNAMVMALAGVSGLMCAVQNAGEKRRSSCITMLFQPAPLLVGVALSVLTVPYHWLGVFGMVFAVVLGVYARRLVPVIGPRANMYGTLFFAGWFTGFLGRGAIEEDSLPGIALALWIVAAAGLVLKVGLYPWLGRGTFRRTVRTAVARGQDVLAFAADAVTDAVTGTSDHRDGADRGRTLVSALNDAALTVDGMTATDDAPAGLDARRIHRGLLALEISAQHLARTGLHMTPETLPAPVRVLIEQGLRLLATGRDAAGTALLDDLRDHPRVTGLDDYRRRLVDNIAVEAHLFADAASSLTALSSPGGEGQCNAGDADDAEDRGDADDAFASRITLVAGKVKGSAAVAENTPRFGGHRHSATARLRLHPENQVATRLAAAAIVAAVVGSFISESRFYWALIGAFTVFNSTNTTREQIVKSVTRVVGTFVGIIIGAGLAHAIGMSVWAVPVICLVMAVGISLAKVDYFFCALGITISVSLMYEQLGTFTDMLLVTRLVETLVGVLCATAASLLIFPVRTGRAVTVGRDAFLESMDNLLDATERALAGTPEEQEAARVDISQEIRNMENARFQVTAAAKAVPGWMPVPASLRYPATTYERASQVTRLVVVDILGPGVQQDYREEVLGELRESRHRLEGYFSGPRDGGDTADTANTASTAGQPAPTVADSAPDAPADGRTLAAFSHLGILRTAVDDLGHPHLTPTRAA